MPRTPRQPAYRLHKARNCAVVTINGKNHYLGPFDSPESHQEYATLIDKWKLTQGLCPSPSGAGPLTIGDLIGAYWEFATGYYVKGGKPTNQLSVVSSALRYVWDGYHSAVAKEFGPLALQGLQERMIADGLSRNYINGHTRRIKLMFRWAVSKELVPPDVHLALSTVGGLKKGRTKARESKRVRAVPDHNVEATLPHLPKVVADMVRFQRLTGSRPGEVCCLRPCDIDRSGDVWAYWPAEHKMEHAERQRVIFIGPRAKEVLMPYLLRDAQSHCFSPVESEVQRKVELRANRKSKVQPSQADRRKPRPQNKPANYYTRASYGRAISRAADRAFGEILGPITFEEVKHLVSREQLTPRDILRHRPTSETGQRLPLKQAYHQGRWLHAGAFAELFPTERLAKSAGQPLPEDGWYYMATGHRWAPNQLRHSAGTELRKKYGVEAAQLTLGHAKVDTTLIYAEQDLEKAAQIMREVG